MSSSHFINGNIVELFPCVPQSESCDPNEHVIFEIEGDALIFTLISKQKNRDRTINSCKIG